MRLAALLLALVLAVGDPHSGRFQPRVTTTDWVNTYRARHDRPALVLNRTMSKCAKVHADEMMGAGRIFHSDPDDLAACLPEGWTLGGENVGVGAHVPEVLRAFARSRPHRRNLLRARYDYLGVGIVRDDSGAWVVLTFADA